MMLVLFYIFGGYALIEKKYSKIRLIILTEEV